MYSCVVSYFLSLETIFQGERNVGVYVASFITPFAVAVDARVMSNIVGIYA
jgi:hypothetical protein